MRVLAHPDLGNYLHPCKYSDFLLYFHFFSASDGVDDSTVCDGISIGKQPVDVNRLAKLTKKYKSGKIPPVDWLDRLTFAEIEKLSQKQKQSSNLLFLMIEFPQVQNLDGNSVKTMQDLSESAGISIVYFERNGDAMNVTGSKSEIIRVIGIISHFTAVVDPKEVFILSGLENC